MYLACDDFRVTGFLFWRCLTPRDLQGAKNLVCIGSSFSFHHGSYLFVSCVLKEMISQTD